MFKPEHDLSHIAVMAHRLPLAPGTESGKTPDDAFP